MSEEIRVTVFRRSGRKFFEAQWVDPVTGKKKTKSTSKDRKRDAERVAGELESELRDGRYHHNANVTWKDFRERYQGDVASGLAQRTQELVVTTFNAVERIVDPKFLQSLSAEQISRLQRELREPTQADWKPVASSTIKSYLTHLKVSLNWAQRVGMIATVPSVTMPKKRAGGDMKGRPITVEEYERMLASVETVVGETVASSWTWLLRGLWWSGLRIGEALELHWTDDSMLCVDFEGRRPMFRIRGEAHKSGKDCILPMAPEFAELLATVPLDERQGFVFAPQPIRHNGRGTGRIRLDTVSKIVAKMGKHAVIKVAQNKAGKVKFASAHDLRRGFGFRWAVRVMPAILQQLMRHESIQTTMEYYVGRNAEAAADVVWNAISPKLAVEPDFSDLDQSPHRAR